MSDLQRNCRLFVSGLKPFITSDELIQEFSKFGNITSVDIITPHNKDHPEGTKKVSKKKLREPFAYITFESENAANDAILHHEACVQSSDSLNMEKNAPLCTVVRYAMPTTPSSLCAKRMKKSMDDQETIINLVMKSNPRPNLVMLVHSSHHDRIINLILSLEDKRDSFPFDVPNFVGSSTSKSKNTSFIFLSTMNQTGDVMGGSTDVPNSSRMYWYEYFLSNPILVRFVIRKLYAVDQVVCIPPSEQDGDKRAARLIDAALNMIDEIMDKDEKLGNIVLKVKAFPPKQNNFQRQIVSFLDESIHNVPSDSDKGTKLSMSTSNYTHIFSSLQLFSPQSYSRNMRSTDQHILDEIFMIGISPVSRYDIDILQRNINMDSQVPENDDICRAYFKLKEAMSYYRRDEMDVPVSFEGLIAFDCGSSPGGWTKYLLQDERCKLVYSCDPGMLDSSVENMPGTRYLKMRGKDGINLVQKEANTLSIWVSDMCLSDPKEQVQHLVLAKEQGILAENAMFVLTLKFNTGHSKERFDRSAEEELTRLSNQIRVKRVRIYHLFSNRTGERTLIGQLE